MSITLGKRMAAWRSLRGLTVAELATRSGVTRRMLEYVERDEHSMTVAKLEAVVTKGLRSTLATFFGPLPGRERAA